MKKLLFTFLALLVLGTSAWGATTVTKEPKNMGWSFGTAYQSFNLDNNISVNTSGKGTNQNGYYHTNYCWYIYQNSPTKGKTTFSAKSGYVIQSITLTYSTNSSGSLQDVATSTLVSSGTPFDNVNVDSLSLIVYNTQKSDMAKISKFSVTYGTKVTSVAMEDAMTISVGNTFQIGQITPSDAYCVWSTNDASKVAVDQNGVITAKATGTATIKVKSGSLEKMCAVTVVAATGKSITETFSKAETSSTWQGQGKDPYSVNGDNDLLHWIMRSTRRATSDQVDGVQATRISYNSGTNYIAYNNSATYPAEGGVKRVSFKWVAASGSNPVVFDVDNTSAPLISHHTYLLANKSWTSTQTFTKDVNMAKNVQFRIKLMASGVSAVAATLNISPITITPYLLFTNKAVTASNGFYKFNDDDLINNTGTTLAKANFEVSDANAASIDEDGTIRSKQDNKTITLTAKWGDVTTTTKLTTKLVDPAGSFALSSAVITKNIGDDDFDNAFNKTVGDAFTYESSNTNVATVDENGKVHIVNGGTTQIKAVFAASAPYKAKEFAYTLDVTHTPTEAYFAESFDSIQVGTSVTLQDPKVFGGNGGVYRWKWTNTQRIENEKIDTYQSPKIINNYGEIAMTDVAEGGIKEVAFRYRAKGTTLPIHFFVKAGDKVVEMQRPKSSATLSFAHQFNLADSVGLSIYMEATETPDQQTHILLDTVKIVPYLLYTQKVAAASATGGAYTNTNLINNTGGTPEYSISCPADVATINPTTGAVTIYKSDTVTVTATWGNVKTTYTLQMQAKQIPVISFAAESLNKDLLAGKFTNQLTKPDGVGEISYSSNNEDVATVDANGEVTMHSIGDAKITVNIAENDDYAATSKSYDLTVGFTPTAGTFWSETFSAIPVKDGYTNKDTTVIGDAAVYNWSLSNFAHRSGDLVGNQKNYYGICKSENGYIKTKDMEGGVKCIAFDWSPKNNQGAIDFSVKVGETPYEYISDPRPANQIYQYARLVNAKQNANLEFKLENFVSTVVSAYIVFGKMTIVPYLLYTKKADTISIADYATAKYSNLNLINNIDEGSVAYSIVESTPENIASIEDATKGDITINAGGVIKVQAKWGDVTTTYTLKINKIAPEVKFAKTSIDTTMNAETVTNALSTPAGAGAITYKSSDARIAKVDTNGVVAVVGEGTVTITADVAESEAYEAASASYTLNITDPEEFALEESFPDYAGSPWTSSAQVGPIDVIGEANTWSISYARHRITPKDSLLSGERAVWFNTNGYIETTSSLEGGIKRVQFNYNKVKTKKDFSVIAGDIKDTITAASLNKDYNYNHNFFLKKNATLKIHNITAQDFLVGTIKITPYLYFSLRGDTIKASDYIGKEPYIIEGLKNNTGTTDIIYSSSNPEVAQVNNGEVTVYADAAEPVIITAAWAASETDTVTTTFSLQINGKDQREASFAQDSMTVARGVTPLNTLNITKLQGDSEPVVTYVSSNTEVAVIGANNTVVTVGPGTATITAQISATDKCLAGEASYVLTVTYTPTAGTFWKETFSNAGNIGSYLEEEKGIKGDDGTANKWVLNGVMRPTSDLVGSERGIRVRYNGYITSNVVLEGGIKEVVFNWRPLNTAYAPHFYVQVGDSIHSIRHGFVADANIVLPYAHNFGNQGKSNNATLKIGNYAQETPTAQGYVVIGEVNVLPYLLFKGKQVSLDLDSVSEFNLNDTIINNVDEGTVTFAVDNFTTDVAPTINAGVLDFTNVKKGGKVYVSAKWEDVATTLVISTTITPEVNFAEPTPAAQNLADGSYTNALVAPEGVGAITYTSSNKQVATVDINGVVTFLVAGTTTITAKVAAKDSYKATEKSYDLTINGYTPVAGEAWVETFSLMEKRDPYVTTEEGITGDSLVYGWRANDYIRPNVKQPFRLHTNGYIKTDGNQEGGIKYVALNWIAAATGNIDFTMKVNNDSYQYKGGVTVNKAYRFEHFFNADSICPLEIKMGSQDITAYMSVVNVTVVPYLLYTKKSVNMSVGGEYTNTALIDNRDNDVAVTYSSDNEQVATVDSTGKVTALKLGTAKIKATWGKVWTTYTVNVNGMIISEEDPDLETKLEEGELNVTLQRAMKGGMYNTIYLPFAMDADQVEAAFGEGTVIAAFTGSELNGIKLFLEFDTTVTAIDARTPYLIKPAQDINDPINVGNVTIVKEDNSITSGVATLTGRVPQSTIDISKYYFLMADNTLKYYTTSVEKTMNGLRAYFEINTPSPVQARCVMGGRGISTELPVVDGEVVEGTQKMIIDQRLVIIRDGKMYDAQGQVIR